MSLLDNVLTFDVETTIYKHQNLILQEGVVNTKNKDGSAFCLPQKLVMSGFRWLGGRTEDRGGHYSEVKDATQYCFDASTLIVGFNLKFDLHWARRIGVDISKVVVWDCQLAEFILSNQTLKMNNNSLNSACERYGLNKKLDVVSEEYWEKGIDTDQIPKDTLRTYLYMDLELTEKIFLEQLFQFKGIRL